MPQSSYPKHLIIPLAILIVVGLFYNFQIAKATPLEEAKRIAEVCQGAGLEQTGHEKCTAKEFADIGAERGLRFIGETLRVYQSVNSGYQSYQSCHVLAHRIMNDLGARQKGAWQGLLEGLGRGELDPASCGGGFMHGSIEARASEDPYFKVNAALFEEVCGNPESIQYSSSCAHILGHLALVGSYGKLEEAMQSCDGLAGDFLFQCYGGIFMEDSMRTNLNDHGISDLPEKGPKWLEKQLSRCARYSGPEIVDGCWYDLPEVFAQTHDYDLVQIYDFCSTAPTKSAQERCYIRGSYLVMIVPDELFRDSYAEVMCSLYEDGTRELSICMQDVVGAALTGSVEFLPHTIAFCEARPELGRDKCFGQILGFIKHSPSVRGDRASLCSKLPERYRLSCES